MLFSICTLISSFETNIQVGLQLLLQCYITENTIVSKCSLKVSAIQCCAISERGLGKLWLIRPVMRHPGEPNWETKATHCTQMHCIVMYYTALHYIVMLYTALHYIVMH